MEMIVGGVVGFLLGFLITRLFTHIEVHDLKSQLSNAEKENEVIVRDNSDLLRQNDVLRKKLNNATKNIPDFEEG